MKKLFLIGALLLMTSCSGAGGGNSGSNALRTGLGVPAQKVSRPKLWQATHVGKQLCDVTLDYEEVTKENNSYLRINSLLVNCGGKIYGTFATVNYRMLAMSEVKDTSSIPYPKKMPSSAVALEYLGNAIGWYDSSTGSFAIKPQPYSDLDVESGLSVLAIAEGGQLKLSDLSFLRLESGTIDLMSSNQEPLVTMEMFLNQLELPYNAKLSTSEENQKYLFCANSTLYDSDREVFYARTFGGCSIGDVLFVDRYAYRDAIVDRQTLDPIRDGATSRCLWDFSLTYGRKASLKLIMYPDLRAGVAIAVRDKNIPNYFTTYICRYTQNNFSVWP